MVGIGALDRLHARARAPRALQPMPSTRAPRSVLAPHSTRTAQYLSLRCTRTCLVCRCPRLPRCSSVDLSICPSIALSLLPAFSFNPVSCLFVRVSQPLVLSWSTTDTPLVWLFDRTSTFVSRCFVVSLLPPSLARARSLALVCGK